MKIHCICLVKDEADIVGDVITDACKWSDYIYIYDNGSTDGTTEILTELADKHSNIIFYKWSDRPFEDTIRSEVFHAFKHNSQKGDWWCRLDADEFYIDDPCRFLSEINDRSNIVYHSSYNYYFTDQDLKKFTKNPDSFSYKDLNYYENNWSEIRFVKDSGHLYWPPSSSWPVLNPIIYPKKIRARHYQYRSPEQIKKRKNNRKKAHKESGKFGHDQQNVSYLDNSALLNAEEKIVDHTVLHYDDGEETLIANKNVPMWKMDNSLTARIKRYLKNILFRLNLLKYIYKTLGKSQ